MTKNKFYSFKQSFQLLKDKGIIQKDSSFVKINEGAIHYVYKIKSGKVTYFLKIRLDHFKTDKKIRINSLDIDHERKSIDLVQKYCKRGLVPQVYFFERNFLLLENIQDKNSKNLYQLLYHQRFSDKDAMQVGICMKEFHRDMSKAKESLRSKEKDLEMYQNYLYWRFGIWDNDSLNTIINELKKHKRQYIYGDFNPKNMVLNNGKLRIFDLETIHQGNPIFDVGFFAGHILFNFLNKPIKRISLIRSFFQGYGLNSKDLEMAIKLTLTTLYYRLKSSYSYKVKCRYNKKAVLKGIDDILSQDMDSITLPDLKSL